MAAQIGDKLQNEWKSNATEWARCSGGGAPYSSSLCPDEWGQESIERACAYAYKDASEGTELGDEYYNSRNPVVLSQLAKGAVRLAALLNEVL